MAYACMVRSLNWRYYIRNVPKDAGTSGTRAAPTAGHVDCAVLLLFMNLLGVGSMLHVSCQQRAMSLFNIILVQTMQVSYINQSTSYNP